MRHTKMKTLLSFLFTLASVAIPLTASANGSGWYLYVWDYSTSAAASASGTEFQTTATANVYTIESFVISSDQAANGLGVSVYDSGWSHQYGYTSESSVNITSTGTNVLLGSGGSAKWTKLPAGTYDVTFNYSNLTIRFDVHSDGSGEPVAGTVFTDGGITYTTYSDGHVLAVADDYLRGGDISMLNYVEHLGAKFYDAGSNEKDPLLIMKENGVNIVRLRLYNNPGTSVTYYTGSAGNTSNQYKLPADYLDEDDILDLALRAKKHGMKIVLTFHYSDFWTNGEMQIKPSGWEGYTFDQLKQAVHDYTYNFLQRMNAQGTAPDYVALGNEIQGGLLFGYYNGDGSTASIQTAQINSVGGYCSNMANVAALLNQGSSAVRSVCPKAKVVIHLTMSTSVTKSTYEWFFDAMKNNSLDYDVIGASYYPYWTNSDPTVIDELATDMYSRYSKPTLIMETGYSWTQYRPSGRYGGNYEGQLSLNGTAYNEATEAGQKSFMQALQAKVKSNSHLLGYLYWDPVMVEQKVSSSWIQTNWALKYYGGTWYNDGNMVGNTTWFDYDGKALDVLEAVAEDAVSIPATKTINGYTYTVETEEPYALSMSSVGYSTFYDAAPRLIADGLTAYTATQESSTSLSLIEISAENIPANTGVLLQGDEGTYYLWYRRSEETSIDGNVLKGTVLSQTITPESGDYYYYKLANDGTNGLGWYWGAANGGVFTNGAHKAYLALPQTFAGARSFIGLFSDDSTTGIATVTPSPLTENQCYNLSGQRVGANYKGIVIRNGKKFVNR